MKRLLFVSFGLLVATSTFAQDWKGTGRLAGKVSDAEGKPIASATVKLDCPSRGGGTTVVTDKKGGWAYQGLAACSWAIDISAEGYTAVTAGAAMTSEQLRMAPIEVKMQKRQGPPPELLEAIKNGDAAFAAQKWADARVNYEKVLAMRPDLGPQVYSKIAQAYAGEKNSAKAIEYLELSISAAPTRMDLRFAAAQTALEAGLSEKGVELLKGIDDAAVNGPDGYFNIAIYYLRQSDAKNAIEYFSKALLKDPKLGDAYYWRAMSYVREGKLPEAKADLQKALEVEPAGGNSDRAKKALEQLK